MSKDDKKSILNNIIATRENVIRVEIKKAQEIAQRERTAIKRQKSHSIEECVLIMH